MQKQIDTKLGIAIISAVAVLSLIIIYLFSKNYPQSDIYKSAPQSSSVQQGLKEELAKFSSEEDFKQYLDKFQGGTTNYPSWGGRGGAMVENMALPSQSLKATSDAAVGQANAPSPNVPQPERVSETNVQVLAVDEPDVVKTDGRQIYFSQPQQYYPYIMERPVPMNTGTAVMPPRPIDTGKTQIIKALPPVEADIASKIDKNGDLLLSGNVLLIFAENNHKIYGYDVLDPQNPQEKWTVELKDNNELIGSRLTNGTVYVATRNYIRYDHPCPIEPFITGGSPISIRCDEIYHPVNPVPVDITYSLLAFDAASGSVKEKASFTGTSSSSVLYMSRDAIYLTYNYPGDFVKILADFLDNNQDLAISKEFANKVKKIQDYDISDSAKYTEITNLYDRFTRSLPKDDLMTLQNEINNRMGKYAKEHKREMQNTGIVKVAIPQLNFLATGKVPGEPLNQFSLDEYKGNLRIATTSSGNLTLGLGFGMSGRDASTSDVYVLDNKLNETGSVKDLGVGERIYAVRFIEDKGYVVTFKQIDPFFVLNLANPNKPELAGQLKIPGYSSYLHPISSNVILGVGEENNQVKLTLFDVSSPSNPQELNTYKLNEYWSEVATTHHAFLLDKQHGVFFLPGNQGGYIFSYQDNELKLKKSVSEIQARRAVYINDYLYIIGDNKMVVLDENNWEKVKELDL